MSELSELYRLMKWPDDPRVGRGRVRLERAVERFKRLLAHEWVKELASRGKLRVLEVCAGRGLGGIAFAKAAAEAGCEVEITLTDLREDALRDAREVVKELLGKEARVLKLDALKVHELEETFDLVLMYGFSTPHFDPWAYARFLNASSAVLADDGVVVVNEHDWRYWVFYLVGFKEFIAERVSGDEVVVSVHAGYDYAKGVFKRRVIDLCSGRKAELDLFFWGLAELAAFAWLFFKDVDLLITDQMPPYAGFVLGKWPRRKFRPEELAAQPKALREPRE